MASCGSQGPTPTTLPLRSTPVSQGAPSASPTVLPPSSSPSAGGLVTTPITLGDFPGSPFFAVKGTLISCEALAPADAPPSLTVHVHITNGTKIFLLSVSVLAYGGDGTYNGPVDLIAIYDDSAGKSGGVYLQRQEQFASVIISGSGKQVVFDADVTKMSTKKSTHISGALACGG